MPSTEEQAPAPDATDESEQFDSLPEPTEATTKANWRSPRKEGFFVPLPSGNVARLRRTLDLVTLIKSGRIPNALMGVVNEMITGKRKQLNLNEVAPEQMLELMKLVDDCIPSIFLEPKVQAPPKNIPLEELADWEPEGDAIAIGDIDQQDRMFAFAFAQGGPRDLKTFREQQSESLEGLPDGAGLPDVPIPADGPHG